MPSATEPRRTLEDLEAAAEVYRPVQDRLVYLIAIDQVRPSARNPQHRLEGLDELAESLQEYGLLQPVVCAALRVGTNSLPAIGEWQPRASSAGQRSLRWCVTRLTTTPSTVRAGQCCATTRKSDS